MIFDCKLWTLLFIRRIRGCACICCWHKWNHPGKVRQLSTKGRRRRRVYSSIKTPAVCASKLLKWLWSSFCTDAETTSNLLEWCILCDQIIDVLVRKEFCQTAGVHQPVEEKFGSREPIWSVVIPYHGDDLISGSDRPDSINLVVSAV